MNFNHGKEFHHPYFALHPAGGRTFLPVPMTLSYRIVRTAACFRSFKDTTGSVTAAAAAPKHARIQVMPAACCARRDENPGKVFGL